MPQIISSDIKKVIYFDSDIIVNLDINELWKVELGDKILAAVPENANKSIDAKKFFPMCREGIVKGDDYFNSGVLLMNLEKLRAEENLIHEGLIFRIEHTHYRNFDQDILNYCFSKSYLKLPVRFNRFVGSARVNGELNVDNKICHYAGATLRLDMNEPPNKIFMKYFLKTPWFDEDSIGRMYEGIQQLYVDRQNFVTYVSAMMSGKSRIFFITPQMLEGIKNIFGVQEHEEIILAENEKSLERLINSASNKVIFISPDIYEQCKEFLLKVGLRENYDFINIINFLSDANGVPFNSYELVKLL